MIFAAAAAGRAAAAAAGISYLFHDDDDDARSNPLAHVKQKSTVTISSTLVDQHGVVKAVIYPRIPPNPYSLMIQPRRIRPDQGTVFSIEKYRCNRCLIPMESHSQTTASRIQRKLALLFFWSIPLKARLFRVCTRPAMRLENLNRFERHPIRISIGVQNVSTKAFDIPVDAGVSIGKWWPWRLSSIEILSSIRSGTVPCGWEASIIDRQRWYTRFTLVPCDDQRSYHSNWNSEEETETGSLLSEWISVEKNPFGKSFR